MALLSPHIENRELTSTRPLQGLASHTGFIRHPLFVCVPRGLTGPHAPSISQGLPLFAPIHLHMVDLQKLLKHHRSMIRLWNLVPPLQGPWVPISELPWRHGVWCWDG